MELFDKVRAYFEPKQVNTIKDEAKPFIGRLLTFEALWLIDEDDGGPYVGQWAMRACADKGEWLPFGWVPEEDIRVMDEQYDPEDQEQFRLQGEREHISSVDCWCKPYQDEICPNVWIHNDEPVGNA